jgi:hypothetical protein
LTSETLLAYLRARSVDLSVSEGKLRYRSPAGIVTSDVRALLKAHKAELITLLTQDAEIKWRTVAMRSQVPETGPIPFLIARPVRPAAGRCASCGESLRNAKVLRCASCALAARQVLAELSVSR